MGDEDDTPVDVIGMPPVHCSRDHKPGDCRCGQHAFELGWIGKAVGAFLAGDATFDQLQDAYTATTANVGFARYVPGRRA